MAIDYGDARTGVAVSDTSKTLAGEAWVINCKNENETARILAVEVKKRGVSCIVVGYPKNMNGTVGPRAEKSEHFSEKLRILAQQDNDSLEVVLWDERMTTISAHRVLDEAGKYGKKRKKAIDAVAASLILESYLDYLNSKS